MKKILLFTNTYCADCDRMREVVSKIKDVKVKEINIDKSEKNLEYAKSLSIMSTPTIVFMENETIRNVFVGVITLKTIRWVLNEK
jgi:thiol-disulfide isomerase/thioredoxin